MSSILTSNLDTGLRIELRNRAMNRANEGNAHFLFKHFLDTVGYFKVSRRRVYMHKIGTRTTTSDTYVHANKNTRAYGHENLLKLHFLFSLDYP